MKNGIYLKLGTVLVIISMCVGGVVYVNAGDKEQRGHTDKSVKELRLDVVDSLKDQKKASDELKEELQRQQVDIAVIKQILVKRYGRP